MRRRILLLTLVLSLVIFGMIPAFAQEGGITLTPIGTYETGLFDEGAQEIGTYDPATQRLFVTNANADTVDILDISDPTNPTLINSLTFEDYGAGVTSVAVYNGLIAVAAVSGEADVPGQVVFMDAEGTIINNVEVGVLPDMVTFTPDGAYVLTANEAEPSDDYTIDAEGGVSIIDVSGGAENATVNTVTFAEFNADGARAADLPEDVRIYGPNATVAQDLEPEYIAVSPDSTTAFVTLQENNAIAIIDIATGTVNAIASLGFKDHSQPGNELDAGTDDGIINITNWPVFGMYQPDAVAAYEVDGNVYLFTANEGDTRAYDGYDEEGELGESEIDSAFPELDSLLTEEAWGISGTS